ncbi:2-oxoglutarate-dependent dioxygenase 19-like [Corylus avellana]|uniref:2-oxoglutarate-dependent dioxygenase 19-like n=1 Tax=Corylus avellana TaxID=13451 RepID=UPI00286ABB32|nr:2-oxoglutarate-dependent dioxygenase 19-like [Corylus avellana]
MAASTPLASEASHPSPIQFYRTTCVKKLAGSPSLTSIPSTYAFTKAPQEDEAVSEDPEDPIPVIDFSLLAYGTPDQRSTIIQELGRACKDWGFFMVINHGVPERLLERVIEGISGFFDLTEEEQIREFEGKNVLNTSKSVTSFNTSSDKVFFWRDFLKLIIQHPHHHHFPNEPAGFREILLEYSKRSREVAMGLLKGISMSLGLGDTYIENTMNLQSGLQVLAANLYPPCPEPELAIGLPPHSDHGLLTLLIQNGISGLQVQHQSKWVNVNSIPNAFVVNVADQMEIMSNGKYKSVMHRAFVNEKATRISVATNFGPPLEMVVNPAPELVHPETNAPAYTGIKYGEYMELQKSNKVYGKSCLDHVRILSA